MAMTASGATIEALVYGLRSGVQELCQADTLSRLCDLDTAISLGVHARAMCGMKFWSRITTARSATTLSAEPAPCRRCQGNDR
jgi:hypothetical protein